VTTIRTDHPLAVAATNAIHTGDLDTVRRMLHDHPELARTRLGTDDLDGMSRTLLHVVTDWPGHYPHGAATVALLVEAGAEVDARFRGPHEETPLHWAASSDDVAVLDALLDAGADINAPGAVIGGGPPLADATAFRQWKVVYRLVERGAEMTLRFTAGLELMDRLESYFSAGDPPSAVEINRRSGAPATVADSSRRGICTAVAPSSTGYRRGARTLRSMQPPPAGTQSW
jgi:hypothetical protein